jgi:Domain of unknown function (DUF1844)
VRNLPRMGSDTKQGGFTVNDRRIFTGGDSPPAAVVPPEGPLDGGPDGKTARDAAALPAVDFHTFVLSLGSSALLHLGELEHPETGPAEKDLPLAKHTIDILAMLQAKTKGNLTPAEEKLMESLLYDLRLRYVNASK